jgi:hypothetical protein
MKIIFSDLITQSYRVSLKKYTSLVVVDRFIIGNPKFISKNSGFHIQKLQV